MSDLRRLKDELRRLEGDSSIIIQSGLVDTLMSSVTEFVSKIKEEEALVLQINHLHKQVKNDSLNPEEEKKLIEEQRERADLLSKAIQLKSDMGKKKALLRQLEGKVQSLLGEIRKAPR